MLKKHFKGIRFSSLYLSKALGQTDQDDFLNAAAVLETTKSPEAVKKILESIEKKLKKALPYRFGPRTIDLDLLLYGHEILLDDALTVPHLAMHERRFVIEPLMELGAGELMHPGFDRTLKSYVPEVKHQKCKKVSLKFL